MLYGNDSSGITIFTIMMSFIDKIISWIRFYLTFYSSITCAVDFVYYSVVFLNK
jgi:hypothetical protein